VLHEQTDYAVGISDVFIARLQELGGTAAVESYPSAATTAAEELSRLQTSGAGALLFIVQAPAKADLVLRELAEGSWRPALFTNDVTLGSPDLLARHAATVAGMIGADFGVDEESPRYQEFLRRYQAAYGEAVTFPLYAALSYDAIYLLRDALAAAGLDAEALEAYLKGVKDRPGAAGTLTFDEHGDPLSGHVLKQVQDGALVKIPVASAP
jgi:branched-chain amino acid transport system substrate-binding protein